MEENDLEKLFPQMNVSVPANPPQQEEQNNLISDDMMLGVFGEIMNQIREDRSEIKGLVSNFVDMVINDGDSTTASKEALVNLLKLQADTSLSMSKIADLMTRIKLKEKDTFPKYLAAHQNNTINVGTSAEKRDLIKQIQKFQKKKKEGNS
jgi:hypothetical protein